MLTYMLMLKLIYAFALQCRGIDNEVFSYNSKEVDLQFEDEVYSKNEISLWNDAKDTVDVRVYLKCRLRH